MDQRTTGLRDPRGVLIRKPIELLANHRLLLSPFENERYTGHRQHASACNGKLAMTAQWNPKIQSLFVGAGQSARDMIAVKR
eukprot:4390349-Pyramimonas_sp.AAC.1